MDRRVALSTWGPPPPCIQALNHFLLLKALKGKGGKPVDYFTRMVEDMSGLPSINPASG